MVSAASSTLGTWSQLPVACLEHLPLACKLRIQLSTGRILIQLKGVHNTLSKYREVSLPVQKAQLR